MLHFRLLCTVMGKCWLAYSRHCVSIWTLIVENFFFKINHLTDGGCPWYCDWPLSGAAPVRAELFSG